MVICLRTNRSKIGLTFETGSHRHITFHNPGETYTNSLSGHGHATMSSRSGQDAKASSKGDVLSLFRHASKVSSKGSTDGGPNHKDIDSHDTQDITTIGSTETELVSSNNDYDKKVNVEEMEMDKETNVRELVSTNDSIVKDDIELEINVSNTTAEDKIEDANAEESGRTETGLRRSTRKRTKPKDFMNDVDSEDNAREKKRTKVGRDRRKKQREEEQRKMKEKKAKMQREKAKLELKRQKEAKKLELMKLREEEKRKREEAKKLQKEEEKRKREEEKLKKEMEKRKREETKRLQKEEERRRREEEKLRKEEEKRLQQEAKERSQLRIGNFFTKKITPLKQAVHQSDYEKHFLPFYTRENVVLSSFLTLSKEDLEASKKKIDNDLSGVSLGEQTEEDSEKNSILKWLDSKRVKRGHRIQYQAVTLLQQMTSQEKTDQELEILLSMIPQKYIKFYENVRPPYIGTYSKDVILPVGDPFSKEGTGYNYDYDSDLEWVNEEENDEGGGVEDLESGEDEEEEEDDEEDEASDGEFEGFLDNEDGSENLSGNGNGKRKFVGPLIPKVLMRGNLDKMSLDDRSIFDKASAQCLVESCNFPITPFLPTVPQPKKGQERGNENEEHGNQTPSNTPPSSSRSFTDTGKRKQAEQQQQSLQQQVQLITEPKDLLKLFDEVEGSTFSLGTVAEISQKSLPHYNKKIIKNTVKQYAVRSGQGKSDPSARKWVIKDREFIDALRDRVSRAVG